MLRTSNQTILFPHKVKNDAPADGWQGRLSNSVLPAPRGGFSLVTSITRFGAVHAVMSMTAPVNKDYHYHLAFKQRIINLLYII